MYLRTHLRGVVKFLLQKYKANQMKIKIMYKTSLQDNPRSIFERGTIKVPAGSEAYVLKL